MIKGPRLRQVRRAYFKTFNVAYDVFEMVEHRDGRIHAVQNGGYRVSWRY